MQLDLFSTHKVLEAVPTAVDALPSGASIIPFPQSRNIGRVRHVAAKLIARDGKAREAYWRRSINDLASMLRKSGHGVTQVQQQLTIFRDSVGAELQRLNATGTPRRPNGAA